MDSAPLHHNLALYVDAIERHTAHAADGNVEAVNLSVAQYSLEQGASVDGDIRVHWQKGEYQFSNGAVVSVHLEWDEVLEEGAACPECWISYEVVNQPERAVISPQSKQFISHCQVGFWLRTLRTRGWA